MNIKEKYTNNKLIAEFMEFPTQTDEVDNATLAYYVGDFIKADNSANENDDNVFHPDDMLFHKDIHWLLPVVEKCLDTNEPKWSFNTLENGIDGLYDAVVKFIKTKIK